MTSGSITLDGSTAVGSVPVPLKPLKIFWQTYPGTLGAPADRGIGNVAYKVRIAGFPEQSGTTDAAGLVWLNNVQPGWTVELEIFGAIYRLTYREYSPDEQPGEAATMKIEGAKRRLMILGYHYDPYVTGPQVPDDKLGNVRVEDAILRFQADAGIAPDGEIERFELTSTTPVRADTTKGFGFHLDRAQTSTSGGKFGASFATKLAAEAGVTPTLAVVTVPTGAAPLPAAPAAALAREIYEGQRFVPVQFSRAVTGAHDPAKPELDERGYARRSGPTVSVLEGKSITVDLRRVHLPPDSPLFIKSKDATIARVAAPADGIVPVGATNQIRIDGVSGSANAAAKQTIIEVRHTDASGPLLHRLHVLVYKPISVDVAVHLVTIGQPPPRPAAASGASSSPPPAPPPVPAPVGPSLTQAAIQALFDTVNEVWQQAGIHFSITDWLTDTVIFQEAGKINDMNAAGATWTGAGSEVAKVFALNSKANKLNLYFVPEIIGSGAIGYGSGGVAIVCAEKSTVRVGGTTRPTTTVATQGQVQMIAHEIGHFLNLFHPGLKNAHGDNVPLELEDYWSRRSLMYAFTSLNYQATWPDTSHHAGPYRQRGRQSDVGYGSYIGGPFLCCKPLSLLLTSSTRSEIEIARAKALTI